LIDRPLSRVQSPMSSTRHHPYGGYDTQQPRRHGGGPPGPRQGRFNERGGPRGRGFGRGGGSGGGGGRGRGGHGGDHHFNPGPPNRSFQQDNYSDLGSESAYYQQDPYPAYPGPDRNEGYAEGMNQTQCFLQIPLGLWPAIEHHNSTVKALRRMHYMTVERHVHTSEVLLLALRWTVLHELCGKT
jgi:hypothetical protein